MAEINMEFSKVGYQKITFIHMTTTQPVS